MLTFLWFIVNLVEKSISVLTILLKLIFNIVFFVNYFDEIILNNLVFFKIILMKLF